MKIGVGTVSQALASALPRVASNSRLLSLLTSVPGLPLHPGRITGFSTGRDARLGAVAFAGFPFAMTRASDARPEEVRPTGIPRKGALSLAEPARIAHHPGEGAIGIVSASWRKRLPYVRHSLGAGPGRGVVGMTPGPELHGFPEHCGVEPRHVIEPRRRETSSMPWSMSANAQNDGGRRCSVSAPGRSPRKQVLLELGRQALLA